MIDPHSLAAKIAGTTRPSDDAVRTARLALAACWSECADAGPERQLNRNPYRHAEDQADQDRPWRDIDVDPAADDAVEGPHPPDGVWIVWRTHGDRSNGFNAIYPDDEELQALRQVNADGFGVAEFVEYGPYQDLP